MKTEEEEKVLISKLRRRIEDFLRKTNVSTLVKVARMLDLEVQKELLDKYR